MDKALEKKQRNLEARLAEQKASKSVSAEKLAELAKKYPPNGKYEVLFASRHSVTRELIFPAAEGEPPNFIDLSHLEPKQIAFLVEVRKNVRLVEPAKKGAK